MNSFSVGFIGIGNMGGAILDGMLENNLINPENINLYDIKAEAAKGFVLKGCRLLKSEIQVCKDSDIIYLCIKPQDFDTLLSKLKPLFCPKKLIVTIAAGISTGFIKERLSKEAKIIRVMPNAPLMIGQGASAIALDNDALDDDLKKYGDFVIDVFSSLGVVSMIDESQMNEIICVNGSSPAYVYYFIDAMLQSAVSQGIDKEVALLLITKVFTGATNMLLASKKTPKELIEMVCSPGGTTIETINYFNKNDMYKIIDKGMRACTKRAYELGK